MEDKWSNFKKKLEKLAQLDLPQSAHLIDSWYGQYLRMIRYYKRFESTRDAIDKLDYTLSFFNFSFHLREWIQLFEGIEDKTYNNKWKSFINKYEEIKISRDICNVSKHIKYTKHHKPSIDEKFALFWEHDPFSGQNDWTLFYAGNKVRLVELMKKVIYAWGEFIEEDLKLNLN